MAQWVKALTAKPENLSSIPGPTWWKKRTDSCKLSSDLHMCLGTCSHTYPCTHNKEVDVKLASVCSPYVVSVVLTVMAFLRVPNTHAAVVKTLFPRTIVCWDLLWSNAAWEHYYSAQGEHVWFSLILSSLSGPQQSSPWEHKLKDEDSVMALSCHGVIHGPDMWCHESYHNKYKTFKVS